MRTQYIFSGYHVPHGNPFTLRAVELRTHATAWAPDADIAVVFGSCNLHNVHEKCGTGNNLLQIRIQIF